MRDVVRPGAGAVLRVAAVVLAVAALFVLGGLQALALIAVRDRAQAEALVSHVPSANAARVVAYADRLPLPSALRLLFVRSALEAGNVAFARRELERIGPSPRAWDMRAAIARAGGDASGAARADMAAGDYEALGVDADALAERGDLTRALALERAAVARLAAVRTEPDALAQTQYRIGIFEEASARTFAPGSAGSRSHEAAAVTAYARSVALAPLDERYLLAAGNQALNVGAWAEAAATFARARALDPTSAEPLTGLGDLALRRGNVAQARADLESARALDPHSGAVARLARALSH